MADRYILDIPAITIKKLNIVDGEALIVSHSEFAGLHYDNMNEDGIVAIEKIISGVTAQLVLVAEENVKRKASGGGKP